MIGAATKGFGGKRGLLALLAAVGAATLILYLGSMTTPAKPAEAASTFCNSFAYAPTVGFANGQRRLYFKSTIVCDGYISGATITSRRDAWDPARGAWVHLAGGTPETQGFWYKAKSYTYISSVPCKSPENLRTYDFRTVNYRPTTRALNGTYKELQTRYSSRTTLRC